MKTGITKKIAANANALDILDGLQFRTVPPVNGSRLVEVKLFVRADIGEVTPSKSTLTEANTVNIELKRNETTVIERSPVPMERVGGAITDGNQGDIVVLDPAFPNNISDPFHVFLADANDTLILNAFAGAVNTLLSVDVRFAPA